MLHKISLSLLLLLLSFKTYAVVYNEVVQSYIYTTLSQSIVFNSTMQSGGTLTLSTKAIDGGGNGSDPLTVKLVFYNSSNQIVATTQQTYNLTNTITIYSITATNCGGSCSSVTYVNAEFYGKDASYWAGNYGPKISEPTLIYNSNGNNILYNPDFGLYSTNNYPHGWATTTTWQTCSGNSGSGTCVINNGAIVNSQSGGYISTGGSTSGTAGGYPPAPAYSSGITISQQSRLTSETAQRTGQGGNLIHIDQVGDDNNITIRQGITLTGKNRIELYANGNTNTLNLNQGYNTDGTIPGSEYNNHYQYLNLSGNNNTVTTKQIGGTVDLGHFMESTVSGNTNNLSLTQQGTGSKILFLNVNGATNTVTTNQKDGGAHYLDINLIGNGHTVNATQEGAGNHAATIDFTNIGGASLLNMTQGGASNQTYSIQQSCANPAGCSTNITQP